MTATVKVTSSLKLRCVPTLLSSDPRVSRGMRGRVSMPSPSSPVSVQGAHAALRGSATSGDAEGQRLQCSYGKPRHPEGAVSGMLVPSHRWSTSPRRPARVGLELGGSRSAILLVVRVAAARPHHPRRVPRLLLGRDATQRGQGRLRHDRRRGGAKGHARESQRGPHASSGAAAEAGMVAVMPRRCVAASPVFPQAKPMPRRPFSASRLVALMRRRRVAASPVCPQAMPMPRRLFSASRVSLR